MADSQNLEVKIDNPEDSSQWQENEGSSDENSKWYTKTILQSELADYSPVKGCMVIRPYGYALWENIQQALDKMIKDTGHQNAYFPLFIPESFLNKEKEHVEGFAPECAVVTHGGGKKLEEPLIVRPTSETIINYMFAKWIQSWRDLPLLINQWANVVRWELRTRLFLRTTEFLWQEGHTAHASEECARNEAAKMLGVYETLAKEFLALPVLTGEKTANERFAGAVNTYAIEAMMRDGKALQAGTSHYLGQNFAKAFDIKFQNAASQIEYAYQTSWGVSTRLIGAVIMGHGDSFGLILPPKIAPIQVVIVPIYKTEEEKVMVLDACSKLANELKSTLRIHLDDRDGHTPGFKFNHWEQKGVPVRLNIGPKDIANNCCEVVLRIDGKKIQKQPLADLKNYLTELLDQEQKRIYDRALAFRTENTVWANSMNELEEKLNSHNCFVQAFWSGSTEDEVNIKQNTGATIRVLTKHDKKGSCIKTNSQTNTVAIFAKAY